MVSVPISEAPAKKSTLVIEPSKSAAVAETLMFEPAANESPLTGDVSDTVGELFAGVTEIDTVLEVVLDPALSVATAVSEYDPTGTLGHVML